MYKLIFTSFLFRDKELKLASLLDDSGRPVLFDAPSSSPTLIGNIYVGRVLSIVKDINAAFVEIAPGIKTFYALDNPEPFFIKQNHKEKGLSVGDEILIEITKDAFGTKDAVSSSVLTFKNESLILSFGKNTKGVSKKIKDASKREALKEFVNSKNDDYGLLVRTNAADLPIERLNEDYEELLGFCTEIINKAPYLKPYSVLRKQKSDELYLINSLSSFDIEEIITDDEKIHESLKEEGLNVRLYKESLPLYKVYSLETRLEEALAKKVYLKSGGYLYIEPTEALTVVDVNSGKKSSKKDKEENALEINIEAAKEIVTQLSLRNISGIVIVDFINMYKEENKKKLLSEFSSFAKNDHVGIQVLGLTSLGLCEITRKKTKKPLKSQIFD